MGYVPQFKKDIFISYRHALNEGRDKWIDAFCDDLKAALHKLVSQEVEICRDDSILRAGDQWWPELADAIDTAAVFVAIISRTYLESEVCRKELDRVLGRCKSAKEALGTKIIPIFKQPLKKDQKLPPEVPRIHYYEFYDFFPPESKFFREFTPGNEETSKQYGVKFSRLAQDLSNVLEELKGYINKHTVGQIYLATVGGNLHEERDILRCDLQQRRYRIVPEYDYLWNASDINGQIIENLSAAELCVHLVARTTPDDEPETPIHAKMQLRLAVEAMKHKGKPPPLVWIKPASTEDASARALIDYIEQDLTNEGVEFLEGGLEEFKTQIYAKLPPRPSTRISTPANREIAVIVEENDIGATGKINDYIVKELKIDLKRIIFIGTSARDSLYLKKILTHCGKCLIYWGGRSEEWLNEILSSDELVGHVGDERLCVYAGPPATLEKKTFRTTKARMIQGVTGINKEELNRFVIAKEAVTCPA